MVGTLWLVLSFAHALCKLSELTDNFWTPVSIPVILFFSKTLPCNELRLRIHIPKNAFNCGRKGPKSQKRSKKMQKSMQYIKRKTDQSKGKVQGKLLIQEKLKLKERSVGKECDCTGLRKTMRNNCLTRILILLMLYATS